MKKIGILMIIGLLAVSGVMAAMAYSTASVTNEFSLTTVNSSEALLALIANPDHNAAYEQKGRLVIDLDRGFNDNPFGQQKESTYTWNDLFTIKNNSEHDVRVTIDLEGIDGVPSIYVRHGNEDWVKINHTGATGPWEYVFDLEANEDEGIDMKVYTAASNSRYPRSGKLIVSAEVIEEAI